MYGLLTGTGSIPSKNLGRPWSNTATLAPKRVTNKVQPISLNSSPNNNQTNSLNNLMTNSTNNNLINIQSNNQINCGQVNNQSNNLTNFNALNDSTNQSNQRNKAQQQTLPTIYESNHYKETDLQPLFNCFTNGKKPPLPSDPPPNSLSYSNVNNKTTSSFNTSSNDQHHHQPSAVLKQLPSNNSENELNKESDKIEIKNDTNDVKSNNVSVTNDISNNILNSVSNVHNNFTDNTTKFETDHNSPSKDEQLDNKQLKLDKLQNKFEEEITIYQRPVPLPGRLMKSSSLEDLFKIKVCKLNPLCPNNDQSKAIIFCANPGPLTKIKSTNSTVKSLKNESEKFTKLKIKSDLNQEKKETNLVSNDCNDNSCTNGSNETTNSVNSNSIKNDAVDNSKTGEIIENESDEIVKDNENDKNNKNINNKTNTDVDEDKNSLNTAIAASFKGFLGDLQACKQNQLVLSTFRPLSNTVQQSTGITGTLNTSSTTLTTNVSIKIDPGIEQINTMPNPFSFKKKKQSITSLQTSNQSNQSDTQSLSQTNQDEQQINKPDITDLLKEFDVCFGNDGVNESNDLISFSNETNKNSTNTDQFDSSASFGDHFPPPPPSLLNSTTYNSSVNICPSSNTSSNSSCKFIEQSNLIKPSNCSSTESLQYNESSSFAKLLNETALKQASLGPATLQTCGSKIQLTELDLSKYFVNYKLKNSKCSKFSNYLILHINENVISK